MLIYRKKQKEWAGSVVVTSFKEKVIGVLDTANGQLVKPYFRYLPETDANIELLEILH